MEAGAETAKPNNGRGSSPSPLKSRRLPIVAVGLLPEQVRDQPNLLNRRSMPALL